MKKLLPLLIILSFFSCQEQEGAYVCPPCDLPCDTLRFYKPGICPHCQMTLIKKTELIDESTLVLNEVELKTGAGVFLIEGGKTRKEKTIKVYYYQPEHFSTDSKILMVIPGAGRNGDSYRDAWREHAEKYGVLILAPMYEADNYPFEDYHLCGLIKDINLEESVEFVEGTNQAHLKEEVFEFKLNRNNETWLFNDFDRIFDLVVAATNSSQTNYDLFGHSAGAQILHRLALFADGRKVNRIIAANAGFYTLPDLETELPFGVKNLYVEEQDLVKSFHHQLTLLIGELDNEEEDGGTLLRSETVDQQGLHRLARAKYFFEFSKRKANLLNATFNWKIEIVPKVGHQQELMGNAAAKKLYEE